MEVDINVKGRPFVGTTASSINSENRLKKVIASRDEIPDLPFPGNTGIVVADSICNLENQLLTVNPGLATAQETDFWCWAASPQMVIKFHEPEKDLRQCEIITEIKLNGSSRNGNPICCPQPTNIDCLKNGRPEDVFENYRYEPKIWDYARLGVPKPEQIRWQLCNNGIFPHIVLNDDNGGHVVNITAITKVGDDIFVEIFDPLRKWFKVIPYQEFTEGFIWH